MCIKRKANNGRPRTSQVIISILISPPKTNSCTFHPQVGDQWSPPWIDSEEPVVRVPGETSVRGDVKILSL